MSFIKCISCGDNNIKILNISENGHVKTRCKSCGITGPDEIKKDKRKVVEVIYR